MPTLLDTVARPQQPEPPPTVEPWPASRRRAADEAARYAAHVNPKWVRLLQVLGLESHYSRCEGMDLLTAGGRRIQDFLSGYCVYNPGHNHPEILAALHEEIDQRGPAMLQSHVPGLAGELAGRLCSLAGGRLTKVFFTSSGSEGVETAIKFARAHTGRPGIVYCDGAFHGLTCGALSLMGNDWWRAGFGPLLPGTHAVPFGDLDALERRLLRGDIAAFVVEPVQAEAGIVLPSPDYLRRAAELCRRHGALLVLDEVQTGLYRTGPFLAAHHFGVDPDMVILAKALSGGLVPVGAVLMTDVVQRSVYSTLSRAFIHASTFGENALAMRAGLATLEVMERHRLGERAAAMGEILRRRLRERLRGHEMVEEVRGLGLLNGIVFRPPRSLGPRALHAAFTRVHPGMFGQMLVSRLYGAHGILTQICGNHFMVLKVAPPLVLDEERVDNFVDAADAVLREVHSGTAFWTESLALVRRVVGL